MKKNRTYRRPIGSALAGEPARDSEMEALRTLLLGVEQSKIDEIQQRLDAAQLDADKLSRLLPAAIQIRANQDQELADSLSSTIGNALQTSIKENPQPLVDAISPIMGPAIRLSIRQAINSMVQSLNTTLEHSFSVQGLKWRLEAFRTKKPFAEVVLLNSLVYDVEQVLLVHRRTGLLLQHVVADSDESTIDADLLSGLLTAIRDFAQDSFGAKKEDSLHDFRVGKWDVWVEQGSQAVIAGVIDGEAPLKLKTTLKESLESIHIRQRQALEEFDGDTTEFELSRPALESCLQFSHKSRSKKKKISPALWLVPTAILLAIATWLFFSVRENWRWSDYLAQVKLEPGVVITDSGKRDDHFFVEGLRDPSSRDPQTLLQASPLDPARVEARWKPYESHDPQFVLQRARQQLQPPASGQLTLQGNVLHVSGEAPRSWIERARELGPLIPGVSRINTEQIIDSDLAWHAYLDQLRSEPGLVVTTALERDGQYYLSGLRDPLSRDPQTLVSGTGLDPQRLTADWKRHDSTEPAFALRRAENQLNPPPTVELQLNEGVLQVTGEASREWIRRTEWHGATIPGVNRVDIEQLRDRDQHWRNTVEQLRHQPGIVVTAEERRGDHYVIAGLRDPLAIDPADLFRKHGIAAGQVRGRWEPYHSEDRALTVLRASKRLRPPPEVTAELQDRILQLRGRASHEWIVQAQLDQATIPGIVRIDYAELVDVELEQISILTQKLHQLVVHCDAGSAAMRPDQEPTVKIAAETIDALDSAAHAIGKRLRVDIVGHTNGTGPPAAIDQLQQQRAENVIAALVGRGVKSRLLVVRSELDRKQPNDTARSGGPVESASPVDSARSATLRGVIFHARLSD